MDDERGTVIVTGASKGIGVTLVRTLRVQGYNVLGIARTESLLSSLAMEKIGTGSMTFLAADISKDHEKIREAIEKIPKIKAIIFNAATLGTMELVRNMDIDNVRQTFEINLFSQINLVTLLLPTLRIHCSRIIFLTSGILDYPTRGFSIYASTKAALNTFAAFLAKEEPNLLIFNIQPGIVDTEMFREAKNTSVDVVGEEYKNWVTNIHLVDPEEPAKSISKLISKNINTDKSGIICKYDDQWILDL